MIVWKAIPTRNVTLLIYMTNKDLPKQKELLFSSTGTFGGLSGALVQSLKFYDIDYKEIFSKIGLSTNVDQNFNNRISKDHFIRLLQDCVIATKDEAFPIEAGKQIHPTMLHHIGLSSLASESLRDLFNRLNRFQSLISDDFSVEMYREEETSKLLVIEKLDTCFTELAPALLIKDAILAAMLRAIRIVYDPEFVPIAAFTTRNPEEKAKKKIQQYFGSTIHYGADFVALEISNKLMDAKLPGANLELARIYDEASLDQLADLQKQTFSIRVEKFIISNLKYGSASKEYVADLLHMSSRNLQKKLEKEDTTFKEILENVRYGLAIKLLKDKSQTVGEVAISLGYSNTANFSRAFKKWSGSYPANYIKTH